RGHVEEPPVGGLLAATDEGVTAHPSGPAGADAVGRLDASGEVGGGSAAGEGGPQVGHVAARRAVAGDAALHERRVAPADAGDLARGVDVVDARALVDVDVDEAVRPDRAPGGYG